MTKATRNKDASEATEQEAVPKKRRGRPPGNEPPKRDVILDRALCAFAHHGIDRVNLRQIAADADVNVSLIVHQFGSKMGLWKAVVDHVGGVLQSAALDVIDDNHRPLLNEERLQLTIDHLVDTACGVPERGLLLIQDIGHPGERFEYLFEKLIKPTHDLILPLIEKVVSGNVCGTSERNVDPEFLTFILAGSISTAIAMRPLMARFTNAAVDDESFRLNLKAALQIAFMSPFSNLVTPPNR